MDFSTSEKLEGVTLISGGARRIGAAIARALHESGMNVAVHYRASGAEARHLVDELNRLRPDSARAFKANLRSVAQVERLAEQAQAAWGRLDALVNNASTYFPTPFGKIEEDAFDELVDSNFKAPLFLSQACVPRFGARGAIVNILDTLARHPRPAFAPYNAAKSALWSLTETLAVELAPRVRVNGVAPGHILWPEAAQLNAKEKGAELANVPLGRLGAPEEIARGVRFLLSPASSYLTGVILPVDGGLRLGG